MTTAKIDENYYFVNLSRPAKTLEVTCDTREVVTDYMKENKIKNFKDLENYDLKCFEVRKDADKYLSKYLKTLKKLDNTKICKSRDLPAMLYKRRYLVQTLLGEKNKTTRHYKKDWKKGDLINLHDQTFFLTVQLTKIKKTGQNYEYHFNVPV